MNAFSDTEKMKTTFASPTVPAVAFMALVWVQKTAAVMMAGTKMVPFANHAATTVAAVLVCLQILANVTLAI